MESEHRQYKPVYVKLRYVFLILTPKIEVERETPRVLSQITHTKSALDARGSDGNPKNRGKQEQPANCNWNHNTWATTSHSSLPPSLSLSLPLLPPWRKKMKTGKNDSCRQRSLRAYMTKTPTMETNRSQAAAQTASVGDRDMMTFLPGGGGGGGGTAAAVAPSANATTTTSDEASSAAGMTGGTLYAGNEISCGMAGTAAGSGAAATSAYDVDESSNAAMDDDAFNASLDALLGDASCMGYDTTLVSSAVAAAQEVTSPPHGNGGRRKRKSSPSRPDTSKRMAGSTDVPLPPMNTAGSSSVAPTALGRGALPSERQHQRHGHRPRQSVSEGVGVGVGMTSESSRGGGLHFSARSMVQLPPMFASRGEGGTSSSSHGGTIPLPSPLPLPLPLATQQRRRRQQQQQEQPTIPASSVVGSLMSRSIASGNTTAIPNPQQRQHRTYQDARDRRRHRTEHDDVDDAASMIPHPSSMSTDPWDAFRTRFAAANNNDDDALVVDASAPSSSRATSAAHGNGPMNIPASPRPPPSSSSGAAAAAAAAGASMGQSSNGSKSRTTSCPPPPKSSGDCVTGVSEDESDRKNRRSERNLREQERSHKITERIIELRSVLSEAGVRFKPDRYSTLVSVANYVRALQARSASLDEEHRRLLDTVEKASCADVPVLQVHPKMGVGGGGASTRGDGDDPASSSIRSASTGGDEEFLSFVRGIDYRNVFASCAAALSIASVDGRFVDCNEEFLRMTDYTRSELLGDGPRRNCALPHPQPGSSTIAATVSTSASQGARSSPHTTPGNSDSVDSRPGPVAVDGCATAKDDGRVGPPPVIQVRGRQHLSLFNLLGGEDMETVYAAMSRMLRAPEVPLSVPSSSADCGGGTSSSSSSGDSFVRSDLTRSAAEESSSGNDLSNGEGRLDYDKRDANKNASGGLSGDHWTGRVKHTRRKNHVVSSGRRRHFGFSLRF